MDNKVWEEVKLFYNTQFGMTTELVEILSCMEILVMCINGYCNTRIADTLKLDLEYVSTSIQKYLRFDGFETDLGYSPMKKFLTTINDDLSEEVRDACGYYLMLEILLDEDWK